MQELRPSWYVTNQLEAQMVAFIHFALLAPNMDKEFQTLTLKLSTVEVVGCFDSYV